MTIQERAGGDDHGLIDYICSKMFQEISLVVCPSIQFEARGDHKRKKPVKLVEINLQDATLKPESLGHNMLIAP